MTATDCPHVSRAHDERDVPYCPNCGTYPHPEGEL